MPHDTGQPAGRQAVRAGLHRRLLRAADAVPALRALHGVGDRQVQRLQTGAQGHRRRQSRDAHHAARHRLAGAAGARRARGQQRDALRRAARRLLGHGSGRRSDGGPQGHRGSAGAARPQARIGRLAQRLDPRKDRGGQGEVRRSCWKSRWETCDRSRTPRAVDGRRGPARQGRAAANTGSSPAARRTRSTRSRRGRLHGALRIPPPTAPASRDDGHLARVAHHRSARRHRRSAHCRRSRPARTPACSAAPST